MLQNSRVTAFTVFELLRENQLGGKITHPPPPPVFPSPPPPPRLGLNEQVATEHPIFTFK